MESITDSDGHQAPDLLSKSDERTIYYFNAFKLALAGINGKDSIDFNMYSTMIMELPGDSACKLRLLPDSGLSGRLAHLSEIISDLSSNSEICGLTDYSLVSIEGSNSALSFDCDLVIQSLFDNSLHFIDYTASTNEELIVTKKRIVENNIRSSGLTSATAHVKTFKARVFRVSIENHLSSNEPGTLGLRIMDHICSLEKNDRDKVYAQMNKVYLSTMSNLSEMDMTSAPGDYKNYDFNQDQVDKAAELVVTQSDSDSLTFLKECYSSDPVRFPYYKALADLTVKAQKFKKLVHIEASEIFESRDLQSNLAMLEDNYLCKALHAATLTESVIAIDDADNISFLEAFPCSTSEKYLPIILKYKACVQQRNNHVFTIKFNPLYIDEKLKRVLLHEPNLKEKHMFEGDVSGSFNAADEMIRAAISDYSDDYNYFTSISLDQPKDNIWKKIQTISALASNDMDNLGRSTCSMLDGYLTLMNRTYLGSCLAHQYEVYKSILSSLKVSPRDSDYYVGVNGSFRSVTIVKMSSTLDSFSKTNYSVIFKTDKDISKRSTRLDGTAVNGIFSTKFYTIDPNQLSYGLRLPMIISSFATWEIENNMENGAIQSGKTPQILFDCTIHSLVGRDQFAQSAEQIRYFYMSAIGYGGSASDIAEKTTFMSIRHSWEALYLLRSYKVAACLNILSASKSITRIEDAETKELAVAFPHSMFPSKSFSQTISSMYVCNIYNKFRAFHEVSDAICYNEIIEEINVYKTRITEDSNAVSGISPSLSLISAHSMIEAMDYIMTDNFIQDEVEFNLSLAVIKPNRYSGSMSFMIGATLHHAESSRSVMDNIFTKLSFCPIEACTMRGSMDKGPSVQENQSLRAASSILEEIIRSYGMDPKVVNKSVLGAANLFDRMNVTHNSFSLFKLAIIQYCQVTESYRYRIIDKDQKGHREISVLNFLFRVGALFVETISRELSYIVGDTEVVHNPNKDKIVEDAIKHAFSEGDKKKGATCFDNSDQKRWGPNHNMNFFSYVLAPMTRSEPGLARLMIKVFDKTFDKRAKFPEPLIKLITIKKMKSSRSEPINEFINMFSSKIENKIFETVVPQGMCQGIYHDTSSVVHSIKAKSSVMLASSINRKISAKYFTTSDDAEGIIRLSPDQDMVEAIKVVHVSGLRIGNLFNIVRSNPKSAFNFHIAELNSIFYKKGTMATPSLKQRISKIDAGFGVNHIEDFLTCLSASASYLSSGGSYMGSFIVSILNLTLHTEQWLRWDFATSEQYYKPVEMGGFPVIEPISTVLSGGISNLYLRSSHLLSAEHYSRLIVNTLLCPPEKIALSDFVRSGSEHAKVSFKADDLTVFKGTGPFGLFQTVRTDRKLSVFERRHGISKWIIPENFANLDRTSPMGTDFLFTIFRNTSVNTLDNDLGVNSFYVRFAEPWVSYDRKCFKVSKHSPFAVTLGGPDNTISHRDLKELLISKNLVHSSSELTIAFRRCIRKEEFEIMESQLTVRLTDSCNLFEFLKTQEAESFRPSKTSPSIQTVTLRGQSASDSDAYFLAIMKSMSGEKSKRLINNYRKSSDAYDSIMVSVPNEPKSLLDSIVFSDNAVSLYNKFIRRDTKMILPNNVTDLRELCLDIIRNKYTERLGMNTTGSLEMSEERSRPYAYSKWYQELLLMSEKREAQIAARALAGEKFIADDLNIKSNRALITKKDYFEISQHKESMKSVLISASNKTSFVSTVKNWLSANVSFTFDRETAYNLVKGRLTFSHDYYVGSDSFIRHAKTQYLTVTARVSEGTHFIKTVQKKVGRRVKTVYYHTFIFRDNIEGAAVLVDTNISKANEEWLANLANSMRSVKKIKQNDWYSVKNFSESTSAYSKHRKTYDETDKFRFMSITPSTEFKLSANEESLSIMLETNNFELPVSYAVPLRLEKMSDTVTLSDSDFKAAIKVYSKLKARTDTFKKAKMTPGSKIVRLMDFILVESTIDTPEFVIDHILKENDLPLINAVQLDILRTALINCKEIGVNYSAYRFSGSLLNMGKRRRHNYSYFTKRITGDRVDYDSEEISDSSDNEEIILLGESNAREVVYNNDDDTIVVPKYLRESNERAAAKLNVGSDDLLKRTTLSWADEMNMEDDTILNLLDRNATSMQSGSNFDLAMPVAEVSKVLTEMEEDDDYDLYTEEDNEVDTSFMMSSFMPDEVNSVVKTPTLPSDEFDDRDVKPTSAIKSMINEMFKDIEFNDVFDVNEEDYLNKTEVKENHLKTIDDLFTESLSNQYGKIKEIKDEALKSIITGHVVDGNLENPRSIIKYLKNWLSTAGKMKQVDYIEESKSNVTKLTLVYSMIESYGFLDSVDPLYNMFGASEITIPVELSALTVIDAMYS